MAKRYHISTQTGRSELCFATLKECRYGDTPHFDSQSEANSFMELEALREATEMFPTRSKAKKSAVQVPLKEPRVKYEKKADGYHYQEIWVRDENDVPVIYAKINLMTWDAELGKKVPGVVLCDLEVNPEARGRNYPLEFMRMLKKQHNAEVIHTTGMFSDDGYKMYLKMRQHEVETGERIMAIQPGERFRAPREGTEYSFVHSWEEEQAEYQL